MHGMHEVTGSIPVGSTSFSKRMFLTEISKPRPYSRVAVMTTGLVQMGFSSVDVSTS
jgi:hypothetical protein